MNDELLTRGIERIYPSKEALEKVLATGKKLKIYFGIDPTGPLHIGHGANLLKLREFQDVGHEIIILIGDFTAMIGDPTDKMAARVKLSQEQVKENFKNYQDQISKILDPEKTKFKFNSEWLNKLSLDRILELSSEFTAGQMFERDMFQERVKHEKPIYLHEFLYPLMQAYDAVMLDVDVQIGGNDQTFNMLAGRTLMRKLKNKEKFVIATKLLVDPTGKKMGKTEGNMVTLDETPAEMYGQVMSWPDSLLSLAFEICTRLSLDKLGASAASDPKAAKMKLAREIVRLYHDEKKSVEAETDFIAKFQKKEAPEAPEEIAAQAGEKLADVLLHAGAVKSKSDFRRLIKDGAVHNLDGAVITDPDFVVTKDLRLKLGKHRFFLLVLF
ncbi:MAG: tyrosine--tRNA ligase [Candidatus Vogelbacteria bacterium]|nr:tyrosine--tRNA ligase [Candidatus Vogelbacteria bacterium]